MFAFQLALNTNISIKNEVSGKWYESKWYNSNAFQECSLSPNKFALIRGLQIFINLKKNTILKKHADITDSKIFIKERRKFYVLGLFWGTTL